MTIDIKHVYMQSYAYLNYTFFLKVGKGTLRPADWATPVWVVGIWTLKWICKVWSRWWGSVSEDGNMKASGKVNSGWGSCTMLSNSQDSDNR